MKILADDLIPMATGAAFLATGGGGDPRYARLAVQALLETTGSAELLALADLPDDSSVISVGMSGSPSVGIEKLPNGLEPLWAVQMLEDHLNIKADALIASIKPNCSMLVLRQHDIAGCSVSVVFRSKAQCAGNGMPFPSTATRLRDATETPCG